MVSSTFTLYHFIEEKNFSHQLDKLRKKYKRLDEVWTGVNGELIRNPFGGTVIPGEPNHRVFKSYPVGSIPSFWFLYRLDEDEETLYFLAVREVSNSSNTLNGK